VGQSELLATLFVLLGVDRYLAWRSVPAGLSAVRRALIAGCYGLAIAAKETGYVLPLLLAAVAFFLPPAGSSARRELRRLGPLLFTLGGLAIAALLIRGILLGGLAGEIPQVPLRGLGSGARAVAMLAVIPVWARLLLWPAHLQAHYGPPELPVTSALTAAHLTGLILLIGTVGLALWATRRAPVVALGLAWIAISLGPVSNVPIATGVLVAERTLLLPSVGLVLLAGWGWSAMLERGNRPGVKTVAAAAALLILVLGGWRSITRTRVWRNQDRFFAHLEADAPGVYRAQLVSGIYYAGQKRYAAAERAYRRAHLLYQEDPAVFEGFGQLLRIQGRCREALPMLAEGVMRHPEATVLRARYVECALAVGDTARAIATARQAIDLGQPEFRSVLRRLAAESASP
jgi:hypothetical protein